MSLVTVTLPSRFTHDDAESLRDQFSARIDAVLGKAPSRGERPPPLPEGIGVRKALPAALAPAWQRFDQSVTGLIDARQGRWQSVAAPADEAEQDEAEHDADEAWRATERFVDSVRRLAAREGRPDPARAETLYQTLFPPKEGLLFITRRPNVQWPAMKRRMALLEAPEARAVFEEFSGQLQWEDLVAGHERYGRAYGFLVANATEEPLPTDARPEAAAVREALRDFVRKVDAFAEPDDEASVTLSAWILQPYHDALRQPPRGAKRAAPEPAAP